ncbi:MAG: putative lipid II flippase FtsW [Actinobacteria bacterium]|nr:putative lipid II flippase FtsW [Actinomycetota bacterium]
MTVGRAARETVAVDHGEPRRWWHPVASASSAGRRFLDGPHASTQLVLLSGLGLLAFGVMMAASTTISASLQADTHQAMWSQLVKELEFLVLGVPVFWLAVRLPPRAYRLLAYPALLASLIALAAVLTPGIGAEINSARRWIALGPLQLQPSEFAKLAVLLWGADLLARKQQLGTLDKARHLFVPLVPMFAAVCLMIMMEPDLGTTLCFLLILLGLLWTVGTPLRYFGVLLVMIGLSVTALAYAAPYRLERLVAFTDPFKHAQGSGLQTVEGLYALASGGVFGVGLGAGTSKYSWIPNANTDYVFAVIGEELGLIGCAAVLLLFALLAYSGLRISRRSKDPFARLVAGGATVWICGQAVINIGYVTNLLPVTGIPLPFISAGGTSLLATALVFGLLVSLARHEPAAVTACAAAAAKGSPSWVRRWCRIPAPRPYVSAPRRSSQPVRPMTHGVSRAPRPATESARRTQASPRSAAAGPSYRPDGAARSAAARGSRVAPAPLRATGTDSPKRPRPTNGR